jgi:hypothetical protein
MRKTVIILSVLVSLASSSGQVRNKQTTANGMAAQNTFSSVEDTVRHQIGGKLFGLTINPSDSITVIKTNHGWEPNYREYHFILHNRDSHAYHQFTDSALNSWYNFRITTEFQARDDYERFFRPRVDSILSGHIDTIIKDFYGHWLFLTERNGIYYFDNHWACRGYIRITDSVFVRDCMEMDMRKILEATALPKNLGISILLDNPYPNSEQDVDTIRIEVFDKKKSIYRINPFGGKQFYFITPARTIHNFEIIQYTNNTGSLIF